MPFCPKCGNDMVLRTARKGPNAGSQFWGCPRFPSCRGTRNLNKENSNSQKPRSNLPREVGALILQNLGSVIAASAIGFAIVFIGWSVIEGNLAGVPTVTDGDTVRMGEHRIRLYGIDAPERGQTCTDDAGDNWPCGISATAVLRSFISEAQIECRRKDTDRYGRIVAACYKDGIDINAWMVRNGWAVAYTRYSTDYVGEETLARTERLGIWAGEFMTPEEWRRGKRPTSAVDRDCGDFSNWKEAQAFFENAGPGDPHRLDGDGDGIACEALR